MRKPLPASRKIAPGELLQHLSRTDYRGQPLYYGNSGGNRYDAPDGSYGVLYLGTDLATALMETLFHQHQWQQEQSRLIRLAEIESRLLRMVGVLESLHLADLTAPGAMAATFGLNLSQLCSRDYRHTQQLSALLHEGLEGQKERFDGLLYPSRNNYPGTCVALFGRASKKVQVVDDIELPQHRHWPTFVRDYQIAVA